MTLELHSLYKKFYQRSNRNPDDDELNQMTVLIRELVGVLFKNEYYETLSQEIYAEALGMAKSLTEMEYERGFSVYFSRDIVSAIEKHSYTIEIPPQKISRWIEKNEYLGSLYVLTSNHRPNQSKLGVTNLHIETRRQKYMHRHGYPVDLFFVREDVPRPFMHEQLLAKKFQKFRHTSIAYQDSNEWYDLDPEILKNEILSIKQDEAT